MSQFIKLASVIFVAVFALPTIAKAQGSSIYGQALTASGKPAAYASVRVCPYTGGGIPCSPLSSIYNDLALTQPVSNPYTTDGLGNYSLTVASGTAYIVQINANGATYSYLVTASGTGTGSVTSIGLVLPTSLFTVSGTPVTGAGSLTATLNTQNTNSVFAGPCSGGASAPSFRALCPADFPAGVGTVSTFSAGSLAPLFTASVANSTTAPALSFTLSNAAGYTVLGNSSSTAGSPVFTTITRAMLPFTYSGSTSNLATTSGPFTAGNCLTTSGAANLIDVGYPCITPAGSVGAIQFKTSSTLGGSSATVDAAGNITAPSGATATLPTVSSQLITALNHSQMYSTQVAGSLTAAVTACTTTSCDFDAEPMSNIHNFYTVNNYLYGNKLPKESCFVDRNLGAFGIECNSPGFSVSRNAYVHAPYTFLTAYEPGGIVAPALGIDIYSEDTMPGWNQGANMLGPVSGSDVNGALTMTVHAHNAGITNFVNGAYNKYGPGDANLRNYITTKGGWTGGADEGVTGGGGSYYNESPIYFGTVASGGLAGASVVLSNCSQPGQLVCGQIGAGQILLDETTGVLTGTQTATGYGSSPGPLGGSTNTWEIVTTSGYAPPVSTATGSLAAECDIPGAPGTPQTVTCLMALSANPNPTSSAVPVFLTIGGSHIETSKVVSATPATTSGQYNVTLALTYNHEVSSTACASNSGPLYMEQPEYTYTADGYVRRYVFPVTCVPSANTMWVAYNRTGNSSNEYIVTGASTLYHGAMTLDVRQSDGTVFNANTGPQMFTVSANDTFAAGDAVEQPNNTALAVEMVKTSATMYDPYRQDFAASEDIFRGTTAAAIQGGTMGGQGIYTRTNETPSSMYKFACSLPGAAAGCVSGFYAAVPLFSFRGYFGGFAFFNSPPENSYSDMSGPLAGVPCLICVGGGANSVGHYYWRSFTTGQYEDYNFGSNVLTYGPSISAPNLTASAIPNVPCLGTSSTGKLQPGTGCGSSTPPHLAWSTGANTNMLNTFLGSVYYLSSAATFTVVTANVIGGGDDCTTVPTVSVRDLGTSITTTFANSTNVVSLSGPTTTTGIVSVTGSYSIAAGHYVGLGITAGTCSDVPSVDATIN